MRILIVEDDPVLADGLTRSLRHADYAVDCVNHGGEADHVLAAQSYDLVILDLGLPGLDGTRATSDCNWGTDADAQRPGIFGPSHLPVAVRFDGGSDEELIQLFKRSKRVLNRIDEDVIAAMTHQK